MNRIHRLLHQKQIVPPITASPKSTITEAHFHFESSDFTGSPWKLGFCVPSFNSPAVNARPQHDRGIVYFGL